MERNQTERTHIMSWVAVGVGVATAAGGVYSANKASDDAEDAQRRAGKNTIGKDIQSYVGGYSDALPDVLDLEGKYRKKFQGINLEEIQSFLGGQGGLFDLSRMSQSQAGGMLGDARRTDLRQISGQAGGARNLMRSLSPEAAKQVQAATQQAADARQAAQGLTGQEKRSAQQFAREASSDRGRVMDNSSIFGEAMNRDSLLTAKRAEASQMTNNAFGLAQSFYQSPGLQQLNRSPESYQAGQGLLGIGLSSIGSATPQLLNPDMGVNIGAANKQNQLGAASAAAQSSAAQNSAYMNAGTSIFDSYMKYRSTQ
jgi:hypothetical protein